MKDKLYYIGLAMLAMVSCSSDDSELQMSALSDCPIVFSATIDNKVVSRTNGNEWSDKDAIGIFMLKPGTDRFIGDLQNCRYVLNAETKLFQPTSPQTTLLYPAGKDVDFIAYYPQRKLEENYTYTINVAEQSVEGAIDFLFTEKRTTANRRVKKVNLEMKHQLSRIALKLEPSQDVTAEMLKDAEVELSGQQLTAEFKLFAEPRVNHFFSGYGPDYIRFRKSSDQQYSAIVLPQGGFEGRHFYVTLKDGRKYSYELSPQREFNKGDVTSYKMKLYKASDDSNKIDNIEVAISPWTQSEPDVNVDKTETGNQADAPVFDHPQWKVEDVNQYQSTMTIIAKLDPAMGIEPTAKDEIAVFYGDVCRGVGQLLEGYLFIMVYGNGYETEDLHFKYYNDQNRHCYETSPILPFVADDRIGKSEDPYLILLNLIMK